MRVLDLDPVFLEHYCGDSEFEKLGEIFCNDYYPALGEKEILMYGTNWSSTMPLVLEDKAKLVVKNIDELTKKGVKVRFNDNTNIFNKGIAKAYVSVDKEKFTEDLISIEFEIDTQMSGMLNQAQNYYDPASNKRTVHLVARDNSNVRLGEVLKGLAVFIADDGKSKGEYLTNADGAELPDMKKKFYFVQELLNQVVSRKRSASDYNLIEEDGQFDTNRDFFDTGDALKMLREQFQLGNTTVNFEYNPTTGFADYTTGQDDTSPIFRKLIKDYGYRAKGADEVAKWLHKMVEQNTLLGNCTDDWPCDSLSPLAQSINATPSDGTGLYELYVNVVKKFVDGMIHEAERYAGYHPGGMGQYPQGYFPTDQWYSRGNKEDNGYGPFGCVTTEPGKQCSGEHGSGMSYSYGGRQTVEDFNATVSTFKAPPNDQYSSLTLIGDYSGDLYPAGETNDAGVLVEGRIGATTEQKKWPGLYEKEYTYKKPSPYYMTQWAGIDCSGLVIRSLLYAKQRAVVSLGDICTDYDKDKNSCNARTGIDTPVGLFDTSVSRFFNGGNKGVVHYYFNNDSKRKIHRGDAVQYGTTHISMVYSERWGVSQKLGNYDIIHAYGSAHYDDKQVGDLVFSRKALITADDIPNSSGGILKPKGFARINIWE